MLPVGHHSSVFVLILFIISDDLDVQTLYNYCAYLFQTILFHLLILSHMKNMQSSQDCDRLIRFKFSKNRPHRWLEFNVRFQECHFEVREMSFILALSSGILWGVMETQRILRQF